MTDRGKLLELAELCEKAEGASRHCDIDIHRALFPMRYIHKPRGQGEEEPPPGFGGDSLSLQLHEAPFYTASIDAALTLVPEGLDCEISRLVLSGGELTCHAWVGEFVGQQYKATNVRRPALALCAAILRALAVMP